MARTRTIRAAELFDPIDIDLFGATFRLKTPTRSGEEALSDKETDLSEAMEKVADERLDERAARKVLMPIFYDMLDLMLEPNTDSDKKLHAKTTVKKLYTEDKIGLTVIRALIAEIGNARAEERRPT